MLWMCIGGTLLMIIVKIEMIVMVVRAVMVVAAGCR